MTAYNTSHGKPESPHGDRRFVADRALFTAKQTRALDAAAVSGGIGSFELMQRAGTSLLRVLLERWPACREVLVFTGPGNNGGDGFVLAALAARQGVSVTVLMLAPPERLQNDARRAFEMAAELAADSESGQRLRLLQASQGDSATLLAQAGTAAVVIDAMLGTGVQGDLRTPFNEVVNAINAASQPVVAADVPTGLNSDTGDVISGAIRATVTVTFIGLKQGLFTAAGPDYCGDIVYDRLDVPISAFDHPDVGAPSGQRLDIQAVLPLLKPRHFTAHKGDCGHVLVVGGDKGMGGAGMMAAEAAGRAGAGTVTLVTRPAHVSTALARRPEVMVRGIGGKQARREGLMQALDALVSEHSVIVLGPGLGQSDWSRRLLRAVIQVQQRRDLFMVLDADALNLLALMREDICPGVSLPQAKWVVTPHPGEAARLLACSTADVQRDRFAAARALQQQWAAVTLLKGAGTVIASESHTDICTEGNPGMASGGMGDVLAGLTGGLMAQLLRNGHSLGDVVRCAACVHGESADLAAAENGQRGMLATDLLRYVQALVSQELRINSGAFRGRP